jgi:hypothetical protein
MTQMPIAEFGVLHALSKSDCDRGEFVSIGKLFVELEEGPDDCSRASFATALRSLKRKRFVAFKDGDAVRVTESGIAALASM